MKQCSNCKKKKSIKQFYRRSGTIKTVSSQCKKCFSSYCAKRWVKRKIDAIMYKGGKCIDCFITYTGDLKH